MKKILPNNDKTQKYLSQLPTIYLVACWASYGIRPYHFTGKFEKDGMGRLIPLVYDYDDFNGTRDVYILRKITHTTTGIIVTWTDSETQAHYIADALNQARTHRWLTSEKGCVIKCSECGYRLELCFPDGTEIRWLPYCPNCGCKMQDEKKN